MNVLTKDRTTGARINAAIPCTPNPGTRTAASQKQKPLIINENAPKLTKFNGKDRVDKIGLIELLRKPIAAAAINAAGKLAISTPRKMISTTSKLSAVANTVKKVGNICSPRN